jgi:Ca2+-binding EF-hand superfamily protein
MITELRADLAAVTSNFKAAQARHTERDSAQASSKEKYHNRLNEYQTQVSSLLEQLAASVAQSEKHRTLSADLQLQLDSLKGEQHEMLRWETERARAKAARSPSAALRVIVSPPVDKPISPRNKIDSASQQVGTSPVKFISDAPPAASSAAAPIEPQALISVPRRLTPPALVPADSEPVPESPAAAQFPSEQSLSAAHSPSEPSAHASLSLSDSVSTPNLPSHYDEQFAEQVRSPATANESHSPMSIQNSSSAPSLRSLELPKSKPNLSLQSIAEHPSTPPEEVPAAPALQQVAPAAKDAPDSRMFGAVRQRIHEQRRAVSMSPEHDQSLAVSDARPVDNKFNRSLLSALEHSPLPSRDPSPELLSQAAKSEPVVEELPPRELPAQNERLNKSVSALIPVQLVRDQQSPPSIVKHVHRSRNNVSWIDHKFGTGVHLTTTRHIPARTVRRRTSKVISPGKFVHSPAVSNVSLSIDVDVPDISDLGSPHYSQPSLRPSSPVSILRGGPYPVSQVTPTEHDNSEVPMETAPMPDRNSVRVTSDSPSRKNAPAVYCSVSAPLLQYPNGYVRLSPTERQALSSLCKLNTNELLRLQQIFSCNQVGGLISERLFWNVVSLGSPIIALRAPWGAVHKQMFGVFDQLRLGALTCFEFVLALCILGERATFLQRVVFSFDAMDINHDQRLDLNELQLVIDSIRPRDGVEFAEACQQLFLPANAVTTDQHMSVVPSSHRIRVPVGADHETGHPVARCAMPPEYWMTPFHIEHALTQSFLKGDINQDGVLSREEYLAVIANATEHERRLILSPFSIDLTQLLREPMV